MAIPSLISRIFVSIVRAALTSSVLSAQIETGFMRRRVLKTEKDPFAAANSVVKSLRKPSQIYKKRWRHRISQRYTRYFLES